MRLARDAAALLHFIHDHRRALEPEGGLRLAAELGITVNQARGDDRCRGRWPGGGQEVSRRWSGPQRGWTSGLAGLCRSWRGSTRFSALPAVPTRYRRPLLEDAVDRDEDVLPINYGDRWTDGKSPEGGYERINHPRALPGLAGSCGHWPQTSRPTRRCGARTWIWRTARASPRSPQNLWPALDPVPADGARRELDPRRIGSAGAKNDLDDASTMLQTVPGGWHPRPLRALS